MTRNHNPKASLSDQLLELVQVANQNGLYDAADWLQARLWSETAIGLHPANERLQRPVRRSRTVEQFDTHGSVPPFEFSPTPDDK